MIRCPPMEFEITQQDIQATEKAFFRDGKLTSLPSKLRKTAALMPLLARYFEAERVYTEPEVNEILAALYGDYALLRRTMVDFGYLLRDSRGTQYTLADKTEGQ